MVFDRLFGWWDRLWLERNGLEHDIRLEDGLEEEFSASEIRSMDAVIAELDAMLDAYDAAIYEVDEMGEEDEAAGRYNGRDGGRPQIEIDPSANRIPPLWAHEAGHDVASYLDLLPEEDRIVRKTFNETVAYLSAYQLMDRLGKDEPSWLGPFRYTHMPEWERLRRVDDRQQEETLDAVVDAAERRDWGGMVEAAEGYALVRPEEDERSDRTSMVATYLGNDLEQDLELLTRMWRDMEYAPDEEAVRMLEDHLSRDDPVRDRLARTVGDQLDGDSWLWGGEPTYEPVELEGIYSEVMEEVVSETVDELRDSREDELSAEKVVSLLADETYGYTAPMHDGYDDYLDLPHSVGHDLAEELYREGIGIEDIAEEPSWYADLSRDALEYTIEHGVEEGSRTGYDLGHLV